MPDGLSGAERFMHDFAPLACLQSFLPLGRAQANSLPFLQPSQIDLHPDELPVGMLQTRVIKDFENLIAIALSLGN